MPCESSRRGYGLCFDGHGRMSAATEDQPAENVNVFCVGATSASIVLRMTFCTPSYILCDTIAGMPPSIRMISASLLLARLLRAPLRRFASARL